MLHLRPRFSFNIRPLGAAVLGAAVLFGALSTLPAAPATAEEKVEEKAEDPVVATVNGSDILLSELVSMKASIPQLQQMPLQMVFDGLREQAIAQRLIAQKAIAEGLGDDEEVKKRLEEIRGRLAGQVFIAREIDAAITEDRIQQAFEAYKKENPAETEVSARHILLETEDEAKEVIKSLDGGADFAELAKEKSTGPSGANGGDLGFFKRGDMVPAFSDAAFELEKGTYTKEPVKSDFGWHVILVEDSRMSEPPKLDKGLRAQLEDQLTGDVYQELVAGLKEEADVKLVDLNKSE